jgi:2,3-bisphosphoglycerate-dependent phosphoglycerate mutase
MHKLVLIRHGESLWNLENRFTGWTDVELTATGVAQAKQAGLTLKNHGFDFDLGMPWTAWSAVGYRLPTTGA